MMHMQSRRALTSCRVKARHAVNDDAVEEERRRVHLDGAAQETVEDPHVPEQTAELRLTSFMSYELLLTSRQMQF